MTRLRRAVHFVPGGNERMLTKALTLEADALVLDLDTHFLQLQETPLATLLKQREARFRGLGAFDSLQTGGSVTKQAKTANS